MSHDTVSRTLFLTVAGKPVYFEENWSTGIGGGLWSTGLCTAKYLQQHAEHAQAQVQRLVQLRGGRRLRVLELGSGNGFLAVCWLAVAGQWMEELVITDTAEHLSLIRQVVQVNSHLLNDNEPLTMTKVRVMEHLWGNFEANRTTANGEAVLECNEKYDVIVGSDVAYHRDLYHPLDASLRRFSDLDTSCIIGVTMADSTPEFFHVLKATDRSGEYFYYRRIADYFMPLESRGNIFGIFVLSKRIRKRN